MVIKEVKIGNATLYLGDCKEILPELGLVDAVATDPPYGINADKEASKNKGKWGWKYYGETEWDKARPNKTLFKLILKKSSNHIIWGGNYFTDYLPPSMRWLIWDKGQRDFSLADFEMAWTSQNKASRIFNYSRAKALQDVKKHPTQKPLALMEWCIAFFPESKTFLDPFMGSGTTGVACMNLGKEFIGIEKDPKYFEVAIKRIKKANDQGRLFTEQNNNFEQLSLIA